MQSKQGIAVGSSIPPAQKPPPRRSDKELARELQLAESLADGNPAKIAKNLSKIIHDPLRHAARDFASSKDLAERARLHEHRMKLVTCMIRADANLLLNGNPEALKARREAKIDAPLRGIEEKLQSDRKLWKGDEASFSAKNAFLIAHRDRLVHYAQRADDKLAPTPVKEPLSSRLLSFGKSAKAATAPFWSAVGNALTLPEIKLPTLSKTQAVGMGVAAMTVAGAMTFGDGLLTRAFNRESAQNAPAPVVEVAQQKIEPITKAEPPVIIGMNAPREAVRNADTAPARTVRVAPEKKITAPLLRPEIKEPAAPRQRAPIIAEAETSAPKARIVSSTEEALRTTLSASIAAWAGLNQNKKYRLGGNSSRYIDCSQFVMGGLRAAREQIEQLHDVKLEIHGLQTIAAHITKVMANTGGYLSGRHVINHKMEPGMIIGVDSGPRGWDKDRWNGIDHIAVTYKEPTTGALYVAESTSERDPVAKKTGVRTMPFADWMDNARSRGYRLIAADILSLAKDNGSRVVAKLSNPPTDKKRPESNYKYASYTIPAQERPTVVPAGQRAEVAFNSQASVPVAAVSVVSYEQRQEIRVHVHQGIGDAEREQARSWARQQQEESSATPQPAL